jgi:dihydroflavonol-4-reductase
MEKMYIVTGGTGFVGNNVVRALVSGAAGGVAVRALVRSKEKVDRVLKGLNVELVFGDIRDKDVVAKLFDGLENREIIFIHTASVVLIGGNSGEFKTMDDVNYNGVKNIIEACLVRKVRLVYVSSVHAITEPPKRRLTTEIEHFDPRTVVGKYAKSKAGASALVMDAIKNQGLDAVMVHPSGITGPNDYSDTHLTQMVINYLEKKIPAAVNGGYDFVDVRDVANGILKAAEKGKTGDRFLLTNKYYSMMEMFTMLHEITGGKKIQTKLPMWLAYFSIPFLFVYFTVCRKRPLYTAYALYTLKSNSNFSHEKASRELGYAPRDLRESLADTVTFLKEHNLVKDIEK